MLLDNSQFDPGSFEALNVANSLENFQLGYWFITYVDIQACQGVYYLEEMDLVRAG